MDDHDDDAKYKNGTWKKWQNKTASENKKHVYTP